MAGSSPYRDYVLDQLAGLGPVTAKRMFGGTGFYGQGLFFALIAEDALFLKVDDVNRPAFEARGCAPFRPVAAKPQMVSRGYYAVPPEVVEDPEELVAWAREAIGAAERARARRPLSRS